jgi:hypothetical protein
MYMVAFKDQGKPVLSSKTFDQYVDVVAYAKTIAPSRKVVILRVVSRIEYDEKTGEGKLIERHCTRCRAVLGVSGRYCPNCGRAGARRA